MTKKILETRLIFFRYLSTLFTNVYGCIKILFFVTPRDSVLRNARSVVTVVQTSVVTVGQTSVVTVGQTSVVTAGQACTTYGPRKLFLRHARAFSIVENVAKARPRIINGRSRISSILQRNIYIEMK